MAYKKVISDSDNNATIKTLRSKKTRNSPSSDNYIKQKDYIQLELKSNQKQVVNFIRSNQISIITADPGCGKTTIALFYALEGLNNKQFEKIIITKPNVETGASIGFLPGEMNDKLLPYQQSYLDNITKIVGKFECDKLFKSGKIVFQALGFVRGLSFEHSCVIFDEFQNANLPTINTFATRLSESSKLIMLGDYYQSDIRNSGLKDWLKIIKNIKGIGHLELDESFQMRAQILVDITNNYKKFLNNSL